MKVQEAIKRIEEGGFYSVWEASEELDKDAKLVAPNLDADRHRWYTVSTDVYKLEDGYIGITGVSSINFEQMTYSDCDVKTTVEEFEEFTTVSYRCKDK